MRMSVMCSRSTNLINSLKQRASILCKLYLEAIDINSNSTSTSVEVSADLENIGEVTGDVCNINKIVCVCKFQQFLHAGGSSTDEPHCTLKLAEESVGRTCPSRSANNLGT